MTEQRRLDPVARDGRRRCVCPCAEWFTPTRSDQIHATPACRTRKCRAKGTQGAARRYKGVTRRRRQTRYAVVRVRGPVLEVLATESARSKSAVRRLFGLGDHQDLDVVPVRYLPVEVL